MKHLQVNTVILGATITRDQLQQHFGPGLEEIKQHLSSCHAFWHGASKVLPLLSNTDNLCMFLFLNALSRGGYWLIA